MNIDFFKNTSKMKSATTYKENKTSSSTEIVKPNKKKKKKPKNRINKNNQTKYEERNPLNESLPQN